MESFDQFTYLINLDCQLKMRCKYCFLSIPFIITTLVGFFLIQGCTAANATQIPATSQLETAIRIPSQEDWVDYGIILNAGEEGLWDY
jgi:hypothetical protein